eukprot:TRINITY_DN7871_c0_g1_i1.p1 TRINITY_DN7871_c0_g1~~TRINITY_DN7871_c0_g1_i1.p1  ORF type:complete len:371 (+),score=107.91 TRINITY_DN7871_c0_g1_i1:56-1114(+)
MAALGKGDSRWIVSERADGTNVNNWHWVERDISEPACALLSEMLAEVVCTDGDNKVRIISVGSVKGDFSFNIRRGRQFFLYDVEVKDAVWHGFKDGKKVASGKVHVPEVAAECVGDYDIQVRLEESGEDAETLKTLMRKQGSEEITNTIAAFLKKLEEVHFKDLSKPEDGEASSASTPAAKPSTPTPTTTTTTPSSTPAKAPTTTTTKKTAPAPKKKSDTAKTISMTVKLRAGIDDVYMSLTQSQRMSAFTQSACNLECEEGSAFSMFNGSVVGKVVKLTKNQTIVWEWRFSSWPADVYSTVRIALEKNDDGTTLKLRQLGVPASDYERTLEGWSRQYFDKMKRCFGWGTSF